LSMSDTFLLTVNAVNDAPVITGQMPVSTAFNTARTIELSDLQVSDVDNTYSDGFTLTAADGANYTRDGNTITPVPNFYGTLTVPVQVNDGELDSNTYQLALTVNPSPETVQRSGTISATEDGGYALGFIGNPGQEYTIQFATDLALGDWQTLKMEVADANGTISIVDKPPTDTPQRFYRVIIP